MKNEDYHGADGFRGGQRVEGGIYTAVELWCTCPLHSQVPGICAKW